MKKHIKNNVWWVGKVDWELKNFHGYEYSTHKGTTYNSYLVKEQKTVLIDTVWKPFAEEFVENLAKETALDKIDFIIANHGEIDHSGALPKLMELIPDTPIYCTERGVKSLKGHYHKEWDFRTVKTGDTIDVGNGKQLIFIEAPMLHWPDSMFCYLTGDNILFSNDAFGQHYATELLFNDLVDRAELFAEAIKYYTNILTPFSPMVMKKINEFASLDLPLDIICTSHGVIWRENPSQIIEKYLQWADAYQEDQVTVIYDSMWKGTKRMAEKIVQGILNVKPQITVKMFPAATTDKNDILTEVFKSKAILVGSPTINRGILSSIAALMEEIKGLGFKNKKGAAFGTYGWSGESVAKITNLLKEARFDIINDGLKAEWNPDEDAVTKCITYGEEIGKSLD